ncbi:DUF1761 domain-containing protein [Cytobacillus depressus]|uniref:DUF1761 domain-containing protein n=1 Tax=Cytobacillus depressus TaxID=1602942 RepID=A0A6L3UYL3_9BACI|nr:DUF1761 domain-containing protein [Cytobacillus depressus]KAB2328474.1 DUF1761 domain-containing protein [Cytobacillus depressus]
MLVDWNQLNYTAIIAGGFLYIIYGAIYYSVLLSDKKGSKNSDIAVNQSKGPVKYIYSVISAFTISFFMSIIVHSFGSNHWTDGLIFGLIIGVLISIVYLKNALFGLMSKRSFLIAIGDHLIIFSLLGALHGLLN